MFASYTQLLDLIRASEIDNAVDFIVGRTRPILWLSRLSSETVGNLTGLYYASSTLSLREELEQAISHADALALILRESPETALKHAESLDEHMRSAHDYAAEAQPWEAEVLAPELALNLGRVSVIRRALQRLVTSICIAL